MRQSLKNPDVHPLSVVAHGRLSFEDCYENTIPSLG